MVQRVALALIVAVGSLTGSAAAENDRDALLRPGVGIGQIRLGMSLAQVKEFLGKPTMVIRQERTSGGGGLYIEYLWAKDPYSWRVGSHKPPYATKTTRFRVVKVETTRRERTRSGVGVGSTHRALQRSLDARCYRPPPIADGGPSEISDRPLQMLCYAGSADQAPTLFRLQAKCLVETSRYFICPKSARRYIAYEVGIAERGVGVRFLGDERQTDWIRIGAGWP